MAARLWPPCSARRNEGSCTTSGIQIGFPVAQTRPMSPSPRCKRPAPAVVDEPGGLHVRRMPQVDEAEPLSVFILSPEHAEFPVEALPEGTQHCLTASFSVADSARVLVTAYSAARRRPDRVVSASAARVSLTIRTYPRLT